MHGWGYDVGRISSKPSSTSKFFVIILRPPSTILLVLLRLKVGNRVFPLCHKGLGNDTGKVTDTGNVACTLSYRHSSTGIQQVKGMRAFEYIVKGWVDQSLFQSPLCFFLKLSEVFKEHVLVGYFKGIF